MKKQSKFEEKSFMCTCINLLISAFKWICLILAVIFSGLTIGLLVMMLIRGVDIPNTILANMTSFMTHYSYDGVMELIDSYGKIKVAVAGIGYGFAVSLTYALIYVLATRFKELFKSIVDGDMFTKENVEIINSSLPLTVYIAFLIPIVIFVIISSTNVFSYTDISMQGLVYIFFAYILKLIFERGYVIEKKSIKFDKEIADLKAREAEMKMDIIKKSATTKKTTKKESASKKIKTSKKED